VFVMNHHQGHSSCTGSRETGKFKQRRVSKRRRWWSCSLLFTNSLLLFLPCGNACAKMAEALAFEVWCVVWSLNATSYIKCKSSSRVIIICINTKEGVAGCTIEPESPKQQPLWCKFFPEWPLGSVPYPLTFTHCSVRTTVKNTRRNPAV